MGEIERIKVLKASVEEYKALMLSLLIAAFVVIFQMLYVVTGLKYIVDSHACEHFGSSCYEIEDIN